jgi:Rab5 GDP/GTP exchange factor
MVLLLFTLIRYLFAVCCQFCLQTLNLTENARRDLKAAIQMLDNDLRNKCSSDNIDELSEMVQTSYTNFVDLMNTEKSNFRDVSPEVREQAVDFFEKCIMTEHHK